LGAIERFGKDAGCRCLARSASAGEQIGVADPIARDGLLKGAGHVLLAHQFLE
jgi:hypothetical protein